MFFASMNVLSFSSKGFMEQRFVRSYIARVMLKFQIIGLFDSKAVQAERVGFEPTVEV